MKPKLQISPTLQPRGAFADLQLGNVMGADIVVDTRDHLGLCSLLARKGKSEMLAARMRECFGIELPPGPRRSAVRDISFAGVAPKAWLVIREQADHAFFASLRAWVGDLASVVDQSDGYAVLRLSGARVAEILGKLISIDLHPRVFPVGHVATTVAAHIGVTLWRLNNDEEGCPVFEILMFRSLARSFWHLLQNSAVGMSG